MKHTTSYGEVVAILASQVVVRLRCCDALLHVPLDAVAETDLSRVVVGARVRWVSGATSGSLTVEGT